MKLLKTLENEWATSKYLEYTDIKVFGQILEVFMAQKMFSSQTGHVFFGDCKFLFN
jgi:hypothetical protein